MLPLGIFRSRTLASANLVALTFLAGFTGLIVTGQQLGGALGLALVTIVDATFTPGIAGAHPAAEAISQALVSDFRPALLLAAAFALFGLSRPVVRCRAE